MDKDDWVKAAALDSEWGKCRETLPGLLSDVLDRILYDRSDCSIPVGGTPFQKLALPERVFIGDTREDVKWYGKKGNYADTAKTLREIAELLEAYGHRAVREKSKL